VAHHLSSSPFPAEPIMLSLTSQQFFTFFILGTWKALSLVEGFNQPKTNAWLSIRDGPPDQHPSIHPIGPMQKISGFLHLRDLRPLTKPLQRKYYHAEVARRSIKYTWIPILGNATQQFGQECCPTSPASFRQGLDHP